MHSQPYSLPAEVDAEQVQSWYEEEMLAGGWEKETWLPAKLPGLNSSNWEKGGGRERRIAQIIISPDPLPGGGQRMLIQASRQPPTSQSTAGGGE